MNEWAKTLVVTSSNPADFKQRITPRLPPFLESLELHSDIWTLEIASSLKLAKLYGTDFLQRSFTRSASWDRLKFFAGNLNYQEMLRRHRWSVFFLIKFRGHAFLHIPCTPKQNVFCCCSFNASKGSPSKGIQNYTDCYYEEENPRKAWDGDPQRDMLQIKKLLQIR